MPLRAKITNPAFGGQAPKMYSGAPIKELPEDDPDDVLFGSLYGVRTMELNRPKKLNSLNGSMIRKIILRLQEWEKSQLANVVVMAGAGEKAFCAGGDVAALAIYNKDGASGQEKSRAYFGLEYQLDHLIATYPKPYVTYMDGITMGGGAGLSMHAPFRIATERTVFAMPETGIGFFPDVGASFFLPRLDGEIGTYLALTSEQVKGVNAYYAGIATHYIHSTSLSGLTQRLAELVFKDYATMQEKASVIDATIEEFGSGLPHDIPMQVAGDIRLAIDRCFRHDTVEEIRSALKQERKEERDYLSSQNEGSEIAAGPIEIWATKALNSMDEKSPTSLKVTLRQMRIGRQWSIAETFKREHYMASRFMAHPDFTNGVTAKLITKPSEKAEWEPASLENVTDEQVDEFFDVSQAKQLELLRHADYNEYPLRNLGLPTDREMLAAMDGLKREGRKVEKEAIVGMFLSASNGKPGVEEKIDEFWERLGEQLAERTRD
ncbi:hypothetical protein MMC25_008022 [Agyrium rufum]|nr:hypothetical protein [Agyrium rufum]